MIRRRLLVLEDGGEPRSPVATYLSERGYQVETALGVAQARTALSLERMDAVIVDRLPPGVSDAALIQELRRADPHLPILFAATFSKDLHGHAPAPQELVAWVERAVRPRPPPPPSPSLMGSAEDAEMAATLAALKAEYLVRLGDKVRELADAVRRAQNGQAPDPEEASSLAHRLYGTAGSYGYHAVSTAAGRVEFLLESARKQATAPDWNAVQESLRELTRLAGGEG
jgi:HPt (histidine-containing phosphotransfer) domain-containing protein